MEEFDKLGAKARLSKAQALSCFLGGLQGALEKVFKVLKPKNLNETLHLAKLQGDILLKMGKNPILTFFFPKISLLL